MEIEAIKEQFKDMCEHIESFFGVKSEEQSKAQFSQHRVTILSQIPEMGELLKTYPMYGAIAFLGQFQFSNSPEISALTKGTSSEVLKSICEKKAVKITEDVRPAWNHLLESNPEALCDILALCFLASSKKSLTKRL